MHIIARINIKHLNHQVLLFHEPLFFPNDSIVFSDISGRKQGNPPFPFPRGKAGGEPSGLKSSDEIKDRHKQPGLENDDTVCCGGFGFTHLGEDFISMAIYRD